MVLAVDELEVAVEVVGLAFELRFQGLLLWLHRLLLSLSLAVEGWDLF